MSGIRHIHHMRPTETIGWLQPSDWNDEHEGASLTRRITSADILAGDPVELLPATPGTVWLPTMLVGVYRYGSQSYISGGGSFEIRSGAGLGYTWVGLSDTLVTGDVGQLGFVGAPPEEGFYVLDDYVNQALYVLLDPPPTGGDGEVDLTVSYFTLEVA